MVNRIWQHHFGEGLVRTPNDFGKRGERPTHPELLDSPGRAVRGVGLVGEGDAPAHHAVVDLSAEQPADAEGLARDPDNRLFGRMNRRRLDAEAIRDSLLAVAGRLDARRRARRSWISPCPGGRCTSCRSAPGRTRPTSAACSIAPTPARSSPSEASRSWPRRPSSSSTTHSWATWPRHWPCAWRARSRGRRGANRRLYALTLGRPPTPAEIDLGLRLLAPDREVDPLGTILSVIFVQNEFIYLD